jgi:hypothetical protein
MTKARSADRAFLSQTANHSFLFGLVIAKDYVPLLKAMCDLT